MSSENQLFSIQQEGETMILSPKLNLSELELSGFDQQTRDVMVSFEEGGYRNIVLDFSGTDYYGSTALGFFIKLWKRVRSVDGQFAFCEVSDYEREVLELTRLDSLWSICATRDDALAAVRRGDAQ